MPTVIDTAALPDPRGIRDAGHIGTMVYVSSSRPGSNFAGKPVSAAHIHACREHGLDIAANWQYGKPGGTAPSDWRGGYDGGHRMALHALALAFEAGMPGWCPIFLSVDEDLSIADWNNTAVHFFRGAGDAIGTQWVGVYGSSKVCAWAVEDDVVGHSTTPGKRWLWCTRAWSGSEIDPAAVLYQRIIDTPSSPGPVVGGVRVDVNDVLAPDWGQWSIDRNPGIPVQPPEAPVVPQYEELDLFGNSSSSRHGARVSNGFWHTEEGNGTVRSLAGYLNNTANGVSYHDLVRDRIVGHVVNDDHASWSVLDANPFSYNLCFAGSRAAWSRDQWMGRADDIRIAVHLTLEVARRKGFAADIIADPYRRADGIADHNYVTRILGIGNHTDVGPNFPWDFAKQVLAEELAGGSVAPVVNEIDRKAQEIAGSSNWLGARVTAGETATPDGVGRFTQFEHGYIYWSPTTGAKAIPNHLFVPFANSGWEAGPLGYPVTDHTVLRDPSGEEWGDVQSFERATLYRRYGQDGYYVHGYIGAYWARSGFENGTFGWPTSLEEELPNGDRVQQFEGGQIAWSPTGTVGLHPQDGPDVIIPTKH